MKVWVVRECEWECEALKRVFDTEDAARRYCELHPACFFDEWDVDTDPLVDSKRKRKFTPKQLDDLVDLIRRS